MSAIGFGLVIVLFVVAFLIDFHLFYKHINEIKDDNKVSTIAILFMIKMIIVWPIIVFLLAQVDEYITEKGKCPELEKVENVYRIK
jgi:hypothetical protein